MPTIDNAVEMVDRLTYINRAWQVYYALHGVKYPLPDLTNAELETFMRVAQEVRNGSIATAMHRDLADKISPAMLRYVCTGVIGDPCRGEA